MVKVLNLVGIGYDLAVEMSSVTGITYGRLLYNLGTPAAVLDYINTINQLIDNLSDAHANIGSRFIDNCPWLYQNAEEGEMWEDQPIVCDGWFELVNGELYYSGNKYTHGVGGHVTRKVHTHDIIEWHRCEPMKSYVKGVRSVF